MFVSCVVVGLRFVWKWFEGIISLRMFVYECIIDLIRFMLLGGFFCMVVCYYWFICKFFNDVCWLLKVFVVVSVFGKLVKSLRNVFCVLWVCVYFD